MELYKSKQYASMNIKDNHLHNKVLQYLKVRPEEKILEIGCGRGFLTKRVQAISKNTIGIDVNPEAVAQGITSNLKVMDATKLDFPSDYFDKIYSCHTIEHIPNLRKLFLEIERVLKPGGMVLLVYPWELIRGAGAIGASFMIFKNPFHCREIHLHKIKPRGIKEILEYSKLKYVKSDLSFFKTPQYFTVLEKANKRSVV